jgi:hypothetical protein
MSAPTSSHGGITVSDPSVRRGGRSFDVVAHVRHFANADRLVGGDPAFDLEGGRVVLGARGVGLFLGLVVKADRSARCSGDLFGDLREGESLGPGDVVGRPVVHPIAGRPQHVRCDLGHIIARDGAQPTVPGRAADDAIRTRHERQVVLIEAVAQEGERETGLANRLLREVVVTPQSERAVGRCAKEGEVDDALHARRDRGIHDGQVFVKTRRTLPARDEEQGVDAAQRGGHGAVAIGRDPVFMSGRELRRIPTNQDRRPAQLREDCGAHAARCARQCDRHDSIVGVALAGDDEIFVSITVKANVIAAVKVTTVDTHDEGIRYTAQFESGISAVAVGRSLATLSVSNVAGASLTSQGSNSALATIRSEAAS